MPAQSGKSGDGSAERERINSPGEETFSTVTPPPTTTPHHLTIASRTPIILYARSQLRPLTIQTAT
jgi:hypothetical protein